MLGYSYSAHRRAAGNRRINEATRLSRAFRSLDDRGGNTTQIPNESEPGQGPDDPFGRIELPGLHPIAVIMLKLVVIIVVALAEGKQGQQKGIARAAFSGIRLAADGVTGAVDEEGAVLQKNNPRYPGDEKGAQCAGPSIPEKSEK